MALNRDLLWIRPGALSILLFLATVLPGQCLDLPCQLSVRECASYKRALAENRLQDAIDIGERALRAAEKSAGSESLTAAQAIDVLIGVYWALGRMRESQILQLAERAVTIRTRVQGESHPDLIPSLHNLVLILRWTGQFKRALPLAEQALRIAQQNPGADQAVLAHCYNELASTHLTAGDPAASLASAEQGLELAEKTEPLDRVVIAESLNCIATARFNQSNMGTEPLYKRSLALYEAALGPNDLLVARTAMNLGMALRGKGEREQAGKMLYRALDIFELVAPNNPNTPHCLNSLALIARTRGDYVEARRLWERALEIGLRVFGEEHSTIAGVLNNMANLRKHMGDFTAAQALLERSLTIRTRVRGPDHPEVAQVLTNLAAVQILTKEYDKAKASIERAVAIREKALGENSPQVALSVSTLGETLGFLGDFQGAQAAYTRAKILFERVGNTASPDYAYTIVGLAAIHQRRGELDQAMEQYERALAIYEQALDPRHPTLASVLVDYGLVVAQHGDHQKAMTMALRAEDIARENLRLTCRYLSEREGLAYAQARTKGLDLAISLATLASDSSTVAQVYGALVRSRTLVLDEAIARARRRSTTTDPTLSKLHDDVTEATNDLVNQLVRGPGKEGSEKYRQALASARERVEKAERAITASRAADNLAETDVTWEKVREALPPRSALVAFARYKQQPVTNSGPSMAKPFYLAFVVKSGHPIPALIPLGEASPIDQAVKSWEMEVSQGAALPSNRAEASYRVAGDNLRRVVWDPITPHLGGVDLVFVVPEGALHLVHFAALPRDEGGYLIESKPTIHQLTAEKDLLAPGKIIRGSGLLALGGAAFDQRLTGERTNTATGQESRGTADRGADRGADCGTCPDFEHVRFSPLPQTGKEVSDISGIFRHSAVASSHGAKIDILRGKQASEAAFRKLAPGKRILHIATHGFFLGELCYPAEPTSRGIGGLVAMTEVAPTAPSADTNLRLAGLALAGANQRITATSSVDDGILTAEEIGILNLDGVEWAVLSACDSGAGTVTIGEGVLGLRRAFLIAGASSVIMSLWSVDDAAARDWMSALYQARLGHGLSTADAVREASLTMLNSRRAKGLSTHPFYWAAFVATGDYR